MTSETSVPATRPLRRDQELDRRYGAIGISAVAAAVRYQGTIRNPKSFDEGRPDAVTDVRPQTDRAA